MYSPAQLLRGLTNPKLAMFELLKLINSRRAVRIVEEDWDNLIILDACRFDLFEESDFPDGKLESKRSLGSKTEEFLKANFQGHSHPDTVYVSANPQIQLHDVESNFYHTIRLWETDWDDEYRTVHPESVLNAAIGTEEKYPNKRLIIHFVQPHYPFLGQTGQAINHGTMAGEGLIKDRRSYPTIWKQLENRDLDEDTVWEAYEENLRITMPYVADLVENLTGKSVVTSDHGNAFGEWGLYDHPGARHISVLTKVPWPIIESSERKQVKADECVDKTTSTDSEIPREQLRDLGYKS